MRRLLLIASLVMSLPGTALAEDPDAGLNAPWHDPSPSAERVPGTDPDAGFHPTPGYVPPPSLVRPDLAARLRVEPPPRSEPGQRQTLVLDVRNLSPLAIPGSSALLGGDVRVEVFGSAKDLSRASGAAFARRLRGREVLAALTLPSIPTPGTPTQRTVEVEIPDSGAPRYWCAEVDPRERIAESNERNNVVCVRSDQTVASTDLHDEYPVDPGGVHLPDRSRFDVRVDERIVAGVQPRTLFEFDPTDVIDHVFEVNGSPGPYVLVERADPLIARWRGTKALAEANGITLEEHVLHVRRVPLLANYPARGLEDLATGPVWEAVDRSRLPSEADCATYPGLPTAPDWPPVVGTTVETLGPDRHQHRLGGPNSFCPGVPNGPESRLNERSLGCPLLAVRLCVVGRAADGTRRAVSAGEQIFVWERLDSEWLPDLPFLLYPTQVTIDGATMTVDLATEPLAPAADRYHRPTTDRFHSWWRERNARLMEMGHAEMEDHLPVSVEVTPDPATAPEVRVNSHLEINPLKVRFDLPPGRYRGMRPLLSWSEVKFNNERGDDFVSLEPLGCKMHLEEFSVPSAKRALRGVARCYRPPPDFNQIHYQFPEGGSFPWARDESTCDRGGKDPADADVSIELLGPFGTLEHGRAMLLRADGHCYIARGSNESPYVVRDVPGGRYRVMVERHEYARQHDTRLEPPEDTFIQVPDEDTTVHVRIRVP